MPTKAIEALPPVLAQLPTPVFMASFRPDSGLTLHVCRECDAGRLKAVKDWAASQSATPVPITVQTHSLRSLAHPRSLEHWLKQFGAGELLHDPTQIASRASGLLLAAKSCHAALGKVISGSFFDPDHRTLFVLAKRRGDITSSLCRQVADIVHTAWTRAVSRFERDSTVRSRINVQVVADLPSRALLPVDAKSASLMSKIGRTIRRWLAPTAIALAMAGAASPAAAKLNAGLPNGPERSATSSMTANFGILSGLSVFADGKRWYETHSLASTGLRQVFGEQGGEEETARIVLAQLSGNRPSERCYSSENVARFIDPDCTPYLGS